MPSIERKLQQSLNRLGRWCAENGFKFSPAKTMCFNFCQLRKQHLFPQLHLNGTEIPHIGSLKSICTKSLDLIKVLSNTTWRADRKVLSRLYTALI